ncbi:bifunctional acetate--CoA ligase family protein/GNAT family N-acetyltransferase [Catenovulum sp. SM1970]|uniref:bifunctional acetate--CoA ligase family protein/GNAT family N-acetyltransferase n=1 Tax=Marinifaba aquimaris TaxID=2741323 RepID=UPI001571ABC9|nr:bifunctional acetate--CoA ligase family protein/GNAT family N-acetyltransferase [Marinifaba aquimaris]NTS78429.1 bifunctional acetate--CoA ligase family protein/GNAT family N-acetyltransferase [Marinifaba aquimaris]
MSLKQIDSLLRPSSVAIIGASNKPYRPGFTVMRNLLKGEFDGPIMPVSPKYKAVNGVLAYQSIADLPLTPDLAIICTKGEKVPGIIDELGQIGAKNAIVIAAGMGETFLEDGTNALVVTLKKAKEYKMSILGPHCLGIIVPDLGLNASYAHVPAAQGKIAFVSQSAAICNSILDWAQQRKIGFSYFVSLGDASDIDFASLIDFLGRDPKTQSILLYVDSIKQGRNFMSAARAASFTKPLLTIKGGRYLHYIEQEATRKQTPDVIYDAAFRRAGMLRVEALQELFAAVETLAHGKPLRGERLAVLGNGFGPNAMAIDTLVKRGGRLAKLEDETKQALSELVPASFTAGNPMTLLGDSMPAIYEKAVEILIKDANVDNLLILHSPSALNPAEVYADHIISAVKRSKSARVNVLVSWIGETSTVKVREKFSRARIPSFRSPEGAVGAFMHMVQYRRNQKLLSETPESIPSQMSSSPKKANELIQESLTQGLISLETDEAAPILSAYGIRTVSTKMATTKEGALNIADSFGYPIALKISCPDLPHKSKAGGVALNLESKDEVSLAADSMLQHVKDNEPDAKVEGFIVQRMLRRAGAHELRIVVKSDPVFGPVILLGEGGQNWDIHRDAVVALPPLNMSLARYQVIQGLAEGKLRDRHMAKPLDRQALSLFLTQVSHMIVDNPEIIELDINPVLVRDDTLTVLDMSMRLTGDPSNFMPLAIRPYPKELEEKFELKTGKKVQLRPILPEDEKNHEAFDASLSKEDRYKRYFGEVPTFSHEQLAKLTQIDYDREMAFIAVADKDDGTSETLGVVRAQMDPDNIEAEFAIVVRSDMKGTGLGKKLMVKIIDYCRAHQTKMLTGITMLENNDMAGLAKHLGFKIKRDFEEGVINMTLVFEEEN